MCVYMHTYTQTHHTYVYIRTAFEQLCAYKRRAGAAGRGAAERQQAAQPELELEGPLGRLAEGGGGGSGGHNIISIIIIIVIIIIIMIIISSSNSSSVIIVYDYCYDY